jgi:hypothetical protein
MKETVDAKKEGKLDEQEVDPITWSHFKLILSWPWKPLPSSYGHRMDIFHSAMELHGKIRQYWFNCVS